MRVLGDLEPARELLLARGGQLGVPLHLLPETTSTNDEAKRAASSGAPHGSTWVAESQTAGRGRQGRTWVSPRGENLLFSVLMRIEARPERVPLVSLVAGLAVADAVQRAGTRCKVRIKWPNDVVVVRESHAESHPGAPFAKIAGILVESAMTGNVVQSIVVGIGINVHTRAFPQDLAPHATSIALESELPPERAEILADVIHGLDRDVAPVLARGLGLVHARLTERDALVGRQVRSEAGEGVASGIDLDGRLIVERDGERNAWNAGEVHLVANASGSSLSTGTRY